MSGQDSKILLFEPISLEQNVVLRQLSIEQYNWGNHLSWVLLTLDSVNSKQLERITFKGIVFTEIQEHHREGFFKLLDNRLIRFRNEGLPHLKVRFEIGSVEAELGLGGLLPKMKKLEAVEFEIPSLQ